jgi:hypothetical protein
VGEVEVGGTAQPQPPNPPLAQAQALVPRPQQATTTAHLPMERKNSKPSSFFLGRAAWPVRERGVGMPGTGHGCGAPSGHKT